MDVTLNRSPSKLKMVECKQLLGCKDTEWSEIGAIVLHIVTFLLTCFLVIGDHERIRIIVDIMVGSKIRSSSNSSA